MFKCFIVHIAVGTVQLFGFFVSVNEKYYFMLFKLELLDELLKVEYLLALWVNRLRSFE